MKKSLLSTLLLLIFVINANAQLVPNTDLTFKEVRKGEVTFAIVRNGHAFYGAEAQNLGYGNYSSAFAASNVWTTFKFESLSNVADAPEDIQDGFLLRAYAVSGDAYSIWGNPGYLNSQAADGWCSFILGLNDQYGQDIKNGAVWFVESGDEGYALMNAATGLYLNGNGAANSTTPVYYQFKSMSDKLTALSTLIADAQKYEDSNESVRNAIINAIDVTDTPSATLDDYLAAMDRLYSALAEATSIATIKSQPTSSSLYNIAGQRVDASYKGVVIKNGKKYIVK